MTSAKYIAMDVHKETISIAVMNSMGKALRNSSFCLSSTHPPLRGAILPAVATRTSPIKL